MRSASALAGRVARGLVWATPPRLQAPLRRAVIRRRKRRAELRAALLLQFESLGENCEFAFVQDHLGVHPLGLFRWSGISAEHLTTALETRLAGIGEPQNMHIWCNPHDHEFYVNDPRYGMVTHTQLSSRDHGEEEVLRTFTLRASRLREKLLEDLTDATKIFVFQSREPLGEVTLARLQAALRALGPAAELLYVHPARKGQRPGALHRVRPGLMVGVISRVGLNGGPWSIRYREWLTLLSRALRSCGREVPRGAHRGLAALNLPDQF